MGRPRLVVRDTHKYHHKKLSGEIKKIKTPDQLEIVRMMIETAFKTHRITYEECGDLLSRLNEQASKIGERKIVYKLGPFGDIGRERKGTIL